MPQENETVAGTTADPTIKYVPLKLGDKEYKLCFDFDAIAIAEEKTGMALLAGVDWRHIGVRRIQAMLYASALKAQPTCTLEEFKPHIKHSTILKIQIALADCWTESTAPKLEVETAEENPQSPVAAPASIN